MAKVEVTMPQMGESITEGTVIAWHKKPGETVEQDEILLEIGTDKVDTDVPSPSGGVLKEILVEEGQTVDVGTAIAYIETEAEAAGESAKDVEPPSETEEEADEAPRAAAAATADDQSADGSGEDAAAAEEEGAEPHLDVKPVGGGEVEVVMPKMGESITEGTVLVWHKQPGEEIELDEMLLEIGTDKVDTDVPSPAAGVLKEILVGENETVDVGTPLAVITTEEVAETEEEPQRNVPEQARQTAERAAVPSGDGAVMEPARSIPRKGAGGRFFSPLVRSIAEKEGLSVEELEAIEGSGREGRLTKEDVLQYVARRAKRAPALPDGTQGVDPPRTAAGALSEGDDYEGPVEVVKMDRMRQIIAEHMVRSKATSAHVTSFAEADVTNLVTFRERQKEAFHEREGVKLTYTPFFVKAAVEALREHPILNASVGENEILIKKDLHIGIAVAIGKAGLVAPVIQNAGQKSLSGLAHAAADLARRARNKELQPDELQGGTFTITNIGSLGSLMGTPIINQPQVGILAVGAIKKRPVVIEDPRLGDVVAVRRMVYISLSYDHRIIDGAMGASFLQRFVAALEEVGPDYEL